MSGFAANVVLPNPGVLRPREGLVLAAVGVAGGAGAVLFDALYRTRSGGILSGGLLDEPAHLLTNLLGLLVLALVTRVSTRFALAVLVSAVAVDLDHLPHYFGTGPLSPTTGGRPYTHSFLTVAAVLVVAGAVRRRRSAALGVAFGLVLHFARDVLEGPPGVSLWWPLTAHAFVGTERAFRLLVASLVVTILLLVAARTRGRHAARQGPQEPGRRAGIVPTTYCRAVQRATVVPVQAFHGRQTYLSYRA